jgi:hypothetical protein
MPIGMNRARHSPAGTAALWLLLAGLILAAGVQSRRLVETRRHGLESTPALTADTPPMLNLVLVGLGGFRGIAAEILWFRATRLQQEGRYVELVQLSDWIARLDPRATETWAYSAWNMAYNISAMMRRPEDRLRWVTHGISLLRDDALAWNPGDARLYRELAWLYLHKIGADSDTAHVYYKLALADVMTPLLRPDGTVAAGDDAAARGLATLRLDAGRMLALQTRFGPLDWRLAETHALYWAWQGMTQAAGNEQLACRRSVYQALAISVAQGRFTGNLEQGLWQTAPNPRITEGVIAFFEETLARFPTHSVRQAFAYFLAARLQTARLTGDTTAIRTLTARLTQLEAAPRTDEPP